MHRANMSQCANEMDWRLTRSPAVPCVRSRCHCCCLLLLSVPDHIVLTMPALSPTMEKGNIASWKVKVGDKVKAGDVMAEVSQDKQ